MIDQALFGIAAAVALVSSCCNVIATFKHRGIHSALWFCSFILFFVLYALVSVYGLGVISESFVTILASLIPGFLASGLVYAVLGAKWGKYYLTYTVVLFLLLIYASMFRGIPVTPVVLLIHMPSGLILLLLPAVAVARKVSGLTALLVSVGSLLMGFGGLALTSMYFGNPLFQPEVIAGLLAPLFLGTTLLFTLGVLLTSRWR